MIQRTPEEWRKYDRDRKRAQRAGKPSAAHTRPFVGVDGEGGTLNGRHEYLLLRAGDHLLESGQPLRPVDSLEFLSCLPRDAIYVSYYFDYDVTMILRDLPAERLRRLLDREGRATAKDGTKLYRPLPVDVGPYQIEYLPRKFFKVRKQLPPPAHDTEAFAAWLDRPEFGPWLTVSDISSFFQCSFVKALEDWQITDSETIARIKRGKDARGDFTVMTEEERDYNAQECILLADLAERFREVCRDVGYVPAEWQGPGYLSVAMFRRHGVAKTKDLPPQRSDVWEAANSAYYGGRFEITAVGPVRGPVYQYDINSAYPDVIRRMPCLQHSTWVKGNHAGNRYRLLNVTFSEKEPAMLYGLPIRDKDGGIYCPGTGNGWYWHHELEASIHQTYQIKQAFSLVESCRCIPFGWVPDVYAERLRIGKGARGKVLKLGLNSIYGKTAQSTGGAPYANPVYASLITSLVRTKLQEAIHASPTCGMGLCGTDVYMLATDAVFTSSRLDLPVSDRLGDWDLETHNDGMFIIQPGVYFTSNLDKPKTRGIPQRIVVENRQRFADAFQDLVNTGDLTPVTVQFQMFVGLRQALHRRKPETAGSWIKPPDPKSNKQVSFDWQNKRHAEMTLPITGQETAIRPLPLPGSRMLQSVPYSKEIGRWRELERLEYWDQPDFGSDTFREGEE